MLLAQLCGKTLSSTKKIGTEWGRYRLADELLARFLGGSKELEEDEEEGDNEKQHPLEGESQTGS